MNCPRCTAPVRGPFCSHCGLPLGPAAVPPQTPAPHASRQAAWLVIGGVLSLVLLLILGFLAVQYGPRPTRPTDVAVFLEEFEGQGSSLDPFVLVYEDEAEGTVVYASVSVEDDLGGSIPADWKEQFEGVLWALWKYLPGRFDLAVVGTHYSGSYYSRYMGRVTLREEFGPRPSGLDSAPPVHDESKPTEERPGECASAGEWARFCDRAPLMMDTPETLALVRKTCPGTVRLSSLPAPAAVTRWDGLLDRTSAVFMLNVPKEERPDLVFLDHGEDAAEYLSVSCSVRGTRTSETYTRREYESALR